MSSQPLVSVIIATCAKDATVFEKTLDSVFSLDADHCEVIVVDQNKHSHVQNVVAMYSHEHPDTRLLYVRSAQIGLSRSRNLGFAESKGRWILFLDDDALLPQGVFEQVQDVLEKDELVVFYGNVLNMESKAAYIRRAIKTARLSLFNFDTVCSIGLLFNRKVIEEVGGFDTNFGLGSSFGAGEESDLAIRVLKRDYEIKYLANFTVLHPPPSLNAAKKQLYGHGLGAVYRKHIGSSWGCFFTLGIKFLCEIGMRAALGLFYLFAGFQKSRAHFQYLAGFINGFLLYNERRISQTRAP